jgi:hypothetical protein
VSWDAGVSTEIATMFAAFSWREDEVQLALEPYRAKKLAYHAAYRDTPERRKRAVERTKAWREANRDKARAHSRAAGKRERQRAKFDPDVRARLRARWAKRMKKAYAQNPDQVRQWWREAQRARRARKRADLGLPPVKPGRGRPLMRTA